MTVRGFSPLKTIALIGDPPHLSRPAVTSSFQVDQLHVRIFSNRAEAGRAAGLAAAQAIQAAIAKNGAARVILASAPSQNELVDALVAAPVDWSRVTILHMDEYLGVPASHLAAFRHYQQTHVLNRVKPAAFDGIAGEAADVDAECRRYTALLAEKPIDVVCFGIGENGHLAFNDPPVADFADPQLIKIVELDEACRQQQVNDGCFPTPDAVPRRALTLTVPALMAGRELFGIVPGPRKAEAVRATLRDPIATACPATILRRHPHATLFLDGDSSSLL
jgi:glucosamine-6-phosphate deaminase